MFLSLIFTFLLFIAKVFSSNEAESVLDNKKRKTAQKDYEGKDNSNSYGCGSSNSSYNPSPIKPIQTQIHSYYNEDLSNSYTFSRISIENQNIVFENDRKGYNQSSSPVLAGQTQACVPQASSHPVLLHFTDYNSNFYTIPTVNNKNNYIVSENITVRNTTNSDLNHENVPYNEYIEVIDSNESSSIDYIEHVSNITKIQDNMFEPENKKTFQPNFASSSQNIQKDHFDSLQHSNQKTSPREDCTGPNLFESNPESGYDALKPQCSNKRVWYFKKDSKSPNLNQSFCGNDNVKDFDPTDHLTSEFSRGVQIQREKLKEESSTIYNSKRKSDVKIDKIIDNNFMVSAIEKVTKKVNEKIQNLYGELSNDFFGHWKFDSYLTTLKTRLGRSLNLEVEEKLFGKQNLNVYNLESHMEHTELSEIHPRPIFLLVNKCYRMENELENNKNLNSCLDIQNCGILIFIFKPLNICLKSNFNSFKIMSGAILVIWNQLFIPHIQNLSIISPVEESYNVRIGCIFGHYAPNKNRNNHFKSREKYKSIINRRLCLDLLCNPLEIYHYILDRLQAIFRIPYLENVDEKFNNLAKHFFLEYNPDFNFQNKGIFRIYTKKSCFLGIEIPIKSESKTIINSYYIEFNCSFCE